MGQGLTHIYRPEFAGMDEVVLEPGELGGIEGLHQPVDRTAHPRDAAAAGMVGEPNIKWSAKLDIERHQAAKRVRVGREYADTRTVRHSPVVGAGDIGAHRK